MISEFPGSGRPVDVPHVVGAPLGHANEHDCTTTNNNDDDADNDTTTNDNNNNT